VRNGGGLYHFAGADLMSRYEMALRVARKFGLDRSLISPILTRELSQAAPRPLRSGLKTDFVRETFGIVPRPFEESLSILAAQLSA
jgi:dTDP-4-dehydrorhamnose reductase